MTILEQLQKTDPGNIGHVVYTLDKKLRERYEAERWLTKNNKFDSKYFTDEENQVIRDKLKEHFLSQNWSNQELLNETLSLAQGDDYDGCFTYLGQIEYNCYQEELEQRLRDCGFLPGEINDTTGIS